MSMTLTASSRIRVPEHVHVREFDGELVILDLDKGCYFGLDEVGTRVWQLMSEGSTLEQAVERLQPEYEVAPPRMLEETNGWSAASSNFERSQLERTLVAPVDTGGATGDEPTGHFCVRHPPRAVPTSP